MIVAGIRVRDENVLQLARRLYDAGFDDTAKALVVGLKPSRPTVALSNRDREAILRVLDEPPAALAELRTVLLT